MSNQARFPIMLLSLLATSCAQPASTGTDRVPVAPQAATLSGFPQASAQTMPALAPRAPAQARPNPAEPGPTKAQPAPVPPARASVHITNLADGQEIASGEPVLLLISASSQIKAVRVSLNGKRLGIAQARDGQHRYETTFPNTGDFDLEVKGFGDGQSALATATYRVRVKAKPAVSQAAPATRGRLFNAYVLKAVDHLHERYAGLGYNIKKQFTHEIAFHKYGTLRPTGGGQTMCVAAMLEVIITALEIYSRETGDHSPFEFLPFQSWNTLRPDSFKASIWVNMKLKSAGTGDAIANFGMGERVKFRDLEPGGFININRTTRTGHAVVFISFIDAKGRELPRYSEEVAGFKYFSAQGRAMKGQGGFGYRHAFFSKHGCPAVPFKRDCNVRFSDNPNVLNVGQLLMPSEWKRMPRITDAIGKVVIDEAELEAAPVFDGLTTDD
jgi:hypothetical protein